MYDVRNFNEPPCISHALVAKLASGTYSPLAIGSFECICELGAFVSGVCAVCWAVRNYLDSFVFSGSVKPDFLEASERTQVIVTIQVQDFAQVTSNYHRGSIPLWIVVAAPDAAYNFTYSGRDSPSGSGKVGAGVCSCLWPDMAVVVANPANFTRICESTCNSP